jgi:hypothetical protein
MRFDVSSIDSMADKTSREYQRWMFPRGDKLFDRRFADFSPKVLEVEYYVLAVLLIYSLVLPTDTYAFGGRTGDTIVIWVTGITTTTLALMSLRGLLSRRGNSAALWILLILNLIIMGNLIWMIYTQWVIALTPLGDQLTFGES